MKRFAQIGVALAVAAGSTSPALGQESDPVVEVREKDGACQVSTGGKRVTGEELDLIAREWGIARRTVTLRGAPDAGFRCIGAAEFVLQRSAVQKITFAKVEASGVEAVVAPKPVMIYVPPGKCRILVDGAPLPLSRYRAEVRKWKAAQPEIRFQPHPDAEFDCVDRALRPVTDAKLGKLGFVGNEEAPE